MGARLPGGSSCQYLMSPLAGGCFWDPLLLLGVRLQHPDSSHPDRAEEKLRVASEPEASPSLGPKLVTCLKALKLPPQNSRGLATGFYWIDTFVRWLLSD